MELNKTQNWFYIFTSLSVAFIITLGGWWLYLFFKLASKLEQYELSAVEGNLISMLQWEGLTFFITLFGLAFALFYVFFQDHRKTKTLQAFFASLTHELKTPLASIRLQSQVLNDLLEETQISEGEKEKLHKYAYRLQEDSVRLENELDKHLQLSRLERKAPLNLTSIDLLSFLKNEFKKYPQIQFQINGEKENLSILVDEFAFSLIVRNLIENSIRHAHAKEVDITIQKNSESITILYHDHGSDFQGEVSQLGKLFYKYNSPKGSGIGLYLIKRLTQKMQGNFHITHNGPLNFVLSFKRGEHE